MAIGRIKSWVVSELFFFFWVDTEKTLLSWLTSSSDRQGVCQGGAARRARAKRVRAWSLAHWHNWHKWQELRVRIMSEGRPFYTRGRFVLPTAAVAGYLVWRWRSKEPAQTLQGSQTTTVAEEPGSTGTAVETAQPRVHPKAEATPTPANTPDQRRMVDKGRLTFGKRD